MTPTPQAPPVPTHRPGHGLVVVGASLAGVRAVEAVRRAGWRGPLTLLGDEPHLPYDRPPLSKQFLVGEVDVRPLTEGTSLRDDLGVDVRLGCTATGVDTTARVLHTTAGEVAYDRLLVATGSRPRELTGAGPLVGLHRLRSLDDALAIRGDLLPGRRLVVVGAGFIGAEIASSARALGLEVTIVESAEVPLVRAVGTAGGAALAQLHERDGIRLRCGTGVSGVEGGPAVTGVRLSTSELLPADVVVVGVGATPATEWLVGSGVALRATDGAVVCDAFLRSSDPYVYAAGDLAVWPNETMGETDRLENWTNAAEQGARAALNALGIGPRQPHATVPYFWSDWYGRRIQFVGSGRADGSAFLSGGPGADPFVLGLRRGDRLIGALTVDEPRRTMRLRRHIAAGGSWDEALTLVAPAGAAR